MGGVLSAQDASKMGLLYSLDRNTALRILVFAAPHSYLDHKERKRFSLLLMSLIPVTRGLSVPVGKSATQLLVERVAQSWCHHRKLIVPRTCARKVSLPWLHLLAVGVKAMSPSPEHCFGFELEKDADGTSTVATVKPTLNRDAPSGWATVRMRGAVPEGQVSVMRFEILNVYSCGDVIVGLRVEEGECKPSSIDNCPSYAVVVVPTSIAALNSSSRNFGSGTTNNMYQPILRGNWAVSTSRFRVASVIVELKYNGAGGMSVSVDGKREEVFGTDMDRSRPVAAYNNGKLFPFLTCYGPQTSVRILQS